MGRRVITASSDASVRFITRPGVVRAAVALVVLLAAVVAFFQVRTSRANGTAGSDPAKVAIAAPVPIPTDNPVPVHEPETLPCGSRPIQALYDEGMKAYYQGPLDAALKAFHAAVKLKPDCAYLRCALSRALYRAGQVDAAREQVMLAEKTMDNGDDREQRIVYAWSWHLKAAEETGVARERMLHRERSILDYAIAIYPNNAELWALRAEAETKPMRAVPFMLALQHMDPGYPSLQGWKLPPVPASINIQGMKNFYNITPMKQDEQPKYFPNLAFVHHPIRTQNAEVQKYFDQGLALMDAYVSPSYVVNGAARCFHWCTTLDPRCAMAYWGLSFCLDTNDQMKPMQAAQDALQLALQSGDDHAIRYCTIRVIELLGEGYRQQLVDSLDGAIAAYPDDVDLWVWRGKIYGYYGPAMSDAQADAQESPTVKVLAGIPFELAAQRMHPEHLAPNHELIHDYEAIDRPELGWPYTIQFRRAAPGIPHAQHMQAHLAMRLGRWADAIDATQTTYRLEQAGFPELSPGHHLSVLCFALGHEGRFQEALNECQPVQNDISWARMLRMKDDHEGLEEFVGRTQSLTDVDAWYIGALVKLDDHDLKGATKFIKKLDVQRKQGGVNAYDYREVMARYLIEKGQVNQGLQLFKSASTRAVADPTLHYYGQGGYFLEVWGEQCLRFGRLEDAQTAFLEALAHEHGSVVAALGLEVIAQRRGQKELARTYAARAAEIWKNADPGALDRQLSRLRGLLAQSTARRAKRHAVVPLHIPRKDKLLPEG